MIKVFTGDLLPQIPVLDFLTKNFEEKWDRGFYEANEVSRFFNVSYVTIVDDPKLADYLLIPHSYRFVVNRPEYLDEFVQKSELFNKKIIIFSIGDYSEKISIKNSIVFRMSGYKNDMGPNEEIIPAYASDLGSITGISLRYKGKDKLPIIGFCGYAGFENIGRFIKYLIKILLSNISYFVSKDDHFHVLKQGVYFRRKSIKYLKKSSLVKTNFIIREFYSGHRNTIKIDQVKARTDYIKNMLDSDFILAPKGDGNYSVRFYEALSLGRVPILIDTNCVLPFEEEMDYSKFIIRISFQDIERLPELVSEFYNSLSDADFVSMQETAREAFDKVLRIDVFLRRVLNKEFLKRYES